MAVSVRLLPMQAATSTAPDAIAVPAVSADTAVVAVSADTAVVADDVALGTRPALPVRVAFYNVENLFDTRHDSLKQDYEYLPDGIRHWTPHRYWHKLDCVARTIASLGGERWPALVGLCEVENDSVMYDLTRRSPLRAAGYQYLVTDGSDPRGIDVALLWDPYLFRLIDSEQLTVPVRDLRSDAHARPVLHVSGLLANGDTLDVFVAHFPSRRGGARASEPLRKRAAQVTLAAIDSLQTVRGQLRLLMMGDLNEDASGAAVRSLSPTLSPLFPAPARHQASSGSYRYRGRWEQIDQMLVSPSLLDDDGSFVVTGTPAVYQDDDLVEREPVYGGVRPLRTFNGRRYQGGASDHLPVYADFLVRF